MSLLSDLMNRLRGGSSILFHVVRQVLAKKVLNPTVIVRTKKVAGILLEPVWSNTSVRNLSKNSPAKRGIFDSENH